VDNVVVLVIHMAFAMVVIQLLLLHVVFDGLLDLILSIDEADSPALRRMELRLFALHFAVNRCLQFGFDLRLFQIF